MHIPQEPYNLAKLLIEYDVRWKFLFEEKDVIVEYNCTENESEEVVSLFEFRNSRNTDKTKIERISSIVDLVKLNNEKMILIHHLIMSHNRDAFVYTNQLCNKILGVLSIGIDW